MVTDGESARVACGPGTSLVGSECVPSGTGGLPITCGPGTTLDGGTCVSIPPDAGSWICGAGTVFEGGVCVPVPSDAGITRCGPGTALEGGECLPSDADGGIRCGTGTVLDGDNCVPLPADGGTEQFIVRVGTTTVGADGYSAIPIVVIGTDASGQPSNAAVVLGTSRVGAGSVTPSTVTLSATGATVYFVPCSAALSAACPGPVRVTLALASAPSTILAQSQEITLVAPEAVGSASPCLSGGNVLFFNGDANDYIFSGIETVTLGKWTSTVTETLVHVDIWPTDPNQGEWWDLYFDSAMLSAALDAQVYENAQRWPLEAVGHPGIDVSGDGRGCNTETGRFQIESMVVTNDALTTFTATFEQHCEGGAPALRGCVHVEM
jgi:hypothetical protein